MPTRWLLSAVVLCLSACGRSGASAPAVGHPPSATSHPAASSITTPSSFALTDVQRARLQALLEELARTPFGSGAALSISKGGRLVSFTAGTLRDGGSGVGEATAFNLASVSKLLTASKVVTLAHDGRLELGDTVERWLPGVRLLDAKGTDRSAEIRLRQLLMHRAGLPHQPGALEPASFGSSWSDADLLGKLTASWTITLAHEPGTYAYSNVGYALLGAIIEQVEGMSFADCMQTHLRALGMRQSTFWPATLAQDAAHGRIEKDGEVQFNEPGWYGSRYALPFNGLWASMPDMARFGQILIAAQADDHAVLHQMTLLEAELGHGLGPVHRRRLGSRSLEHDGGGPGFMAWFLAIPERNVTLAVACNGDGESPERARRLFAMTDEMLGVVLEEAAHDAP